MLKLAAVCVAVSGLATVRATAQEIVGEHITANLIYREFLIKPGQFNRRFFNALISRTRAEGTTATIVHVVLRREGQRYREGLLPLVTDGDMAHIVTYPTPIPPFTFGEIVCVGHGCGARIRLSSGRIRQWVVTDPDPFRMTVGSMTAELVHIGYRHSFPDAKHSATTLPVLFMHTPDTPDEADIKALDRLLAQRIVAQFKLIVGDGACFGGYREYPVSNPFLYSQADALLPRCPAFPGECDTMDQFKVCRGPAIVPVPVSVSPPELKSPSDPALHAPATLKRQ